MLRDLEPTEELISLINYYNLQAAAPFIQKDKGFIAGTAEYKRQVKKLVDSVLDGNLVLFEFAYVNLEIPVYHGYVITGVTNCPKADMYFFVMMKTTQPMRKDIAKRFMFRLITVKFTEIFFLP